MQIETLKMFCDLEETKSFTKAAQISEVTQSAVSQQITMMELKFKSLLMERSKLLLRLTREGEVVYEYAKKIVLTFDVMQSELQELKGVISGSINLSSVYSIGLHNLPPILKQFLHQYPTVNVHVDYRRSNEVYDDVLSNVVDLGLVAYPVKNSKLVIVPFRKDPLVLICPRTHPFAKKKSIKLKAIANQKFISFEPDIPSRKQIDRILEANEIGVKTVMEFDNIETVKQAVVVGSGISIVPEITIREEVANKSLACVPFSGDKLFRQLAIIYNKKKVLSPAMKLLIASIKSDRTGAEVEG